MKASTPRSATDSVEGTGGAEPFGHRASFGHRVGDDHFGRAEHLCGWVAITPIGAAPANTTRDPGTMWALRLAQKTTGGLPG